MVLIASERLFLLAFLADVFFIHPGHGQVVRSEMVRSIISPLRPFKINFATTFHFFYRMNTLDMLTSMIRVLSFDSIHSPFVTRFRGWFVLERNSVKWNLFSPGTAKDMIIIPTRDFIPSNPFYDSFTVFSSCLMASKKIIIGYSYCMSHTWVIMSHRLWVSW